MTHADIDPSLCTGEPTLDSLDDGFSPPPPETSPSPEPAPTPEAERALGIQSPF